MFCTINDSDYSYVKCPHCYYFPINLFRLQFFTVKSMLAYYHVLRRNEGYFSMSKWYGRSAIVERGLRSAIWLKPGENAAAVERSRLTSSSIPGSRDVMTPPSPDSGSKEETECRGDLFLGRGSLSESRDTSWRIRQTEKRSIWEREGDGYFFDVMWFREHC